MRNKALCFLCSILALGAPSSWADENTLLSVNVGELAQTQSQTILLNAKAEKAKAERSIKGEDRAMMQPSTVFFFSRKPHTAGCSLARTAVIHSLTCLS